MVRVWVATQQIASNTDRHAFTHNAHAFESTFRRGRDRFLAELAFVPAFAVACMGCANRNGPFFFGGGQCAITMLTSNSILSLCTMPHAEACAK